MSDAMPPIRRHLFLTGDRQVGKSTLLRKLIQAKSLECAGFETQALFIGGQRAGFTLHSRVELPPYENDCICCVRTGEKCSVPVLPVFQENGVKMLQRSLSSPHPFILMDELGRLESDADRFVEAILSCLDSGKRVIGVLQKCSAKHIQMIAEREDVTVITVTRENRDFPPEQLLKQFE